MKRWHHIYFLLALMLSPPQTSEGFIASGSIVHDPGVAALLKLGNFEWIQQTIEAAAQTTNQVTMIANQVRQMEHQVQGLIYQAQNLQQNPLQLLQQISGVWSQYNQLLATADGLTYQASQSAMRFERTYPQLGGTGLGSTTAEIAQASQQLLAQIRFASQTAVRTQSIYEQLCEFERQNALALASAQTAPGELWVAQAQAQQQALTNQQLAQLAQMEAAHGQIQATWIMKQVQEEEAAKESNARWMTGYGAAGFHGVKQGRGVVLP